MAAKTMETLEGEFEQYKVTMEDRFSSLDEKLSEVKELKNQFSNMEGMMRTMMEMQAKAAAASPVADPKEKGVRIDDDERKHTGSARHVHFVQVA